MTIRDGGYRLIVKHSEIHGHGCYAGEPIPAGAFIVEYKGNLVPAEEAYRLEQDATRTGIYTFWVGDEWAIDGWVEENTARYINHCCTPNCGYRVEGRRILIYADRDIAGGEELTIDYSYGAEGEKVPCRCGSPECRGCINAVGDAGD
ncbi:MAG: SET domain-containing protein-lysine N-methyltransferase [Desulfobacterales bacterium]|jgi:SET domain-containing protein|nr:SET domain-containing protein-lysine N-methyltransferase [Desulfobacterales bacterium]